VIVHRKILAYRARASQKQFLEACPAEYPDRLPGGIFWTESTAMLIFDAGRALPSRDLKAAASAPGGLFHAR
jgi:hypothetical protein